ncbi:MAG TPA: biotin/lipoyl-containing protein, partial [Leptolinea sp.]
MATEVFIPKFGQTVEQVSLVKWLVSDGAQITQGQEILEVETDKAIFPVESTGKGWIHIGPFAVGDTIPVLTIVAIIGKEEEKFATTGLGSTVVETVKKNNADIQPSGQTSQLKEETTAQNEV